MRGSASRDAPGQRPPPWVKRPVAPLPSGPVRTGAGPGAWGRPRALGLSRLSSVRHFGRSGPPRLLRPPGGVHYGVVRAVEQSVDGGPLRGDHPVDGGRPLPSHRRDGSQQPEQPRRGRPGFRVLGQALCHDPVQPGRKTTQVRLRVDHVVERLEGRRCDERATARRRHDQHRAEGEHVTGCRESLSLGLLRRHVGRRADHQAGPGQPEVPLVLCSRLCRPRNAEVDDADAVFGQEDVVGFEVTVDEPRSVDLGERRSQPGRESAYQILGQRPDLRHCGAQ